LKHRVGHEEELLLPGHERLCARKFVDVLAAVVYLVLFLVTRVASWVEVAGVVEVDISGNANGESMETLLLSSMRLALRFSLRGLTFTNPKWVYIHWCKT
jgi:hypothetical protein